MYASDNTIGVNPSGKYGTHILPLYRVSNFMNISDKTIQVCYPYFTIVRKIMYIFKNDVNLLFLLA